MDTSPSLPVISLTNYHTPEELARPLRAACIESGFFYLVDHGVPQETISAVFELSKRYFLDTPVEEKAKVGFQPTSGLGYSGIRQETLDATLAKGDLKESFYLARFEDNPQTIPPTLQAGKKLLESFQQGFEQASLRVLAGLARAIDLPTSALTDCHGGKENRMRIIHYPPVDAEVDESDIRASAHSDYGSITLLATESVGGLQVKQKDGSWTDVQHLPGALIVNIADALEFWSGGQLTSTLHQVVMPRTTDEKASRFSIAYFVQPDFDTELRVMTQSTDFSNEEFDKRVAAKGIKPGTRRLSSGEFLKARLAATYS